MSSDEEEYDIGSLLVNNEQSSDESNGEEEQIEIQDEIINSDDEEEEEVVEKIKPKKKKQKVANKNAAKTGFPLLELSDNEDEKNHEEDVYFIEQQKQFQLQQSQNKSKGSFASFGLSKTLLRNIIKKGYKQPTPIQRKTIPLIISGRDVVGMARTGSGKTAAFLLPLIEKLKIHSAKIGVRAIILSPSRELAIQTNKQFKEFSKGTNLRSLLLIGGDSLEDQFGSMILNPDVLIATPGRFLHLKIEMKLDLKLVEFIIYDEADRLFEMGFAEQLNELLSSLPDKRQSMLFSATLPKNLVEFTKAGLINPILIRLDTESKISENLEMCFFSSKKNEREANLLSILNDIIKMPIATDEQMKKLIEMDKQRNESDNESEDEDVDADKNKSKKRKFFKMKMPKSNELPNQHSTIIFVPTRHHVEYITNMLKKIGYATSYIYGSLDQHARKRQLMNFRAGLCNILVVTDVAARGIDIPILANVINYTLPSSSKIFIHRVGRTARAGNKGWAFSILTEQELPYLLDLEIFLGKKILLTKMQEKKIEILKLKFTNDGGSEELFVAPKVPFTKRLILGSIPRNDVENSEELFETILNNNYDIQVMRKVCEKAEKLYLRSKVAPSTESIRRSKELINIGWEDQNLIFGKNLEIEKENFLDKLKNRYSKETVFEFSKKNDKLIDLMNKRRRQIAPIQARANDKKKLLEQERIFGLTHRLEDEILNGRGDEDEEDGEMGHNEIGYQVNEEELMRNFEDGDKVLNQGKTKKTTYKDLDNYLPSFAPKSVIQDQQLSINSGFTNSVNNAAFDIDFNDDKVQNHKQTARVVWDKKKGKYVNNQDNVKYIIGESGQKIPASFRSGKYEDWKDKNKISNYKVGAIETGANTGNFKGNLSGRKFGSKFHHQGDKSPKLPLKGRDDYEKQMNKVKKAVDRGIKVKGFNAKGAPSNEIRTTEYIRKQRELKDKKRDKNGRPSKNMNSMNNKNNSRGGSSGGGGRGGRGGRGAGGAGGAGGNKYNRR